MGLAVAVEGLAVAVLGLAVAVECLAVAVKDGAPPRRKRPTHSAAHLSVVLARRRSGRRWWLGTGAVGVGEEGRCRLAQEPCLGLRAYTGAMSRD